MSLVKPLPSSFTQSLPLCAPWNGLTLVTAKSHVEVLAHLPAQQRSPPLQLVPHPPQLLVSDCRSKQAAPPPEVGQLLWPPVHTPGPLSGGDVSGTPASNVETGTSS